MSGTPHQRPSPEGLRRRLASLAPPARARGALLLLAHSVTEVDGRAFRAGDDVKIYAVYVLPRAAYLGVRSWCDEYEQVDEGDDFTLDLVALEVEKVARLLLKGHRPTLSWLTRAGEPVLRLPSAAVILEAAAQRDEQLSHVPPDQPPPKAPREVFDRLDEWVRRTRLAAAG